MKATLQRTAQKDNDFRGTVILSVEIDCEYGTPLAQSISEKIIDFINKDLRTDYVPCLEESEHYEGGFSLVFFVDTFIIDDFRATWKEAKKLLK